MSILKLFETSQEPEIAVMHVYSKLLQIVLTRDDSRKVENFIATESLQLKMTVTILPALAVRFQKTEIPKFNKPTIRFHLESLPMDGFHSPKAIAVESQKDSAY